jgi:Cu+-exporting ATPase
MANGHKVALGSVALMNDAGAFIGPVANDVEQLRTNGRTVMFVAIDGELAGAIAVGDPIKDSTPGCARRLAGRRHCASSC